MSQYKLEFVFGMWDVKHYFKMDEQRRLNNWNDLYRILNLTEYRKSIGIFEVRRSPKELNIYWVDIDLGGNPPYYSKIVHTDLLSDHIRQKVEKHFTYVSI